ncbi:conserved hypothetical protein [Stutzerimonas stutzeri A1501]|uniref:DUF1883 domain-containing protein n=3 Tax=Stutzerimonas stutzeri TaxID=316 RepID=A4VLN7_STUS1|nr:conserved hypothetical protein [Stutzerimonas stutzeri A1501]
MRTGIVGRPVPAVCMLSFCALPQTVSEQLMKFIHQREHLEEGDIVVIQCSQTCNIRLMNDANFRSFKNGGRHTYHGGAFDRFPAKIVAPSSGFWNITLDTVTRRPISVTRKPNLTYSIKVIRRSASRS